MILTTNYCFIEMFINVCCFISSIGKGLLYLVDSFSRVNYLVVCGWLKFQCSLKHKTLFFFVSMKILEVWYFAIVTRFSFIISLLTQSHLKISSIIETIRCVFTQRFDVPKYLFSWSIYVPLCFLIYIACSQLFNVTFYYRTFFSLT